MTFHYLPTKDPEKHQESEDCKCKPREDYEYGHQIWIHQIIADDDTE